jgi:transposase
LKKDYSPEQIAGRLKLEGKISNGILEGINAKIQLAKKKSKRLWKSSEFYQHDLLYLW